MALMKPWAEVGARGLMVDGDQYTVPTPFVGRLSCISWPTDDTTTFISGGIFLRARWWIVRTRCRRSLRTAQRCGGVIAAILNWLFFLPGWNTFPSSCTHYGIEYHHSTSIQEPKQERVETKIMKQAEKGVMLNWSWNRILYRSNRLVKTDPSETSNSKPPMTVGAAPAMGKRVGETASIFCSTIKFQETDSI